MIKIDYLWLKDRIKRLVIASGVISAIATVYTIPIVLMIAFFRKLRVPRIVLLIIPSIALFLSYKWLNKNEYSIIYDFVYPYWYYMDNIWRIDPFRVIIASVCSVEFVIFGHLLGEGIDDWVLDDEKKLRKKLLPYGRFDYNDRSHMLLFGGTRTGKGVTINHIIKKRILNKNELMVIVSAKLASGDQYSQLAYLRKTCKKYGKPLYVVSMDEMVSDRCQYNPFKYLTKEEMRNALSGMLNFSEEYYRNNFVQWVMNIYKVLKLGNNTISIANILALYQWNSEYDEPSYVKYIEQLRDKGVITEENYGQYVNTRIKSYADIAKKDSANLDNVADACDLVFKKTPNGKKITITDAFEENAIIYFDLNGSSAADSVKMLGGSCIMAELQHCLVKYSDVRVKKTIIFDEASYFMNEHMVKAFFNMSASMGYQFIISTQGPSDLSNGLDEKLLSQLCNNLGQLGVFRVSSPKDVEALDGLIGTTITTENTHRAQSIAYDEAGSIKTKDQMHVPHDVIKNLEKLNMIYYQKEKSVNGEARPVRVVWSTDDL